ncbi:MAG: glycosyltransferase family 4 protein [Candidatus Pacebacteria bacterium]|nr:glycosyltransferase family 4 protein [Candidatus Paceibacterota bacterium]
MNKKVLINLQIDTMRIAQLVSLQESVPPKGKNGLEYMVYYLTEELVSRGHEVTLFATSDSVTSARLIEILPYPMSRGNLFGLTSTHYALTVITKAVEMAEEFDIIHSHLGSPAYYFPNLIDTPIVETVHSAHRDVACIKQEKHLQRYCVDRKSRFYKLHHTFVSRSQKECFAPASNSSVIHNGIKLADFTFQSEGEEYFAYLGYLTKEKGAHFAVQAARKAGVKLKLAGSYYGCEAYFDNEIRPYLKKGQIEYVGVLDPKERNEFLGNAKSLLFPIDWEEPFGLVMIEAMACGTPVIGLNRAAVSEVVKNGKTGFVVENIHEMEMAIKNVDLIKRADCRNHVEKNFSVEKMADSYEKIYQKTATNFRK